MSFRGISLVSSRRIRVSSEPTPLKRNPKWLPTLNGAHGERIAAHGRWSTRGQPRRWITHFEYCCNTAVADHCGAYHATVRGVVYQRCILAGNEHMVLRAIGTTQGRTLRKPHGTVSNGALCVTDDSPLARIIFERRSEDVSGTSCNVKLQHPALFGREEGTSTGCRNDRSGGPHERSPAGPYSRCNHRNERYLVM